MVVSAAARDGSLAAMARLLERAEQAKGRFVAIADRAARFYVPVVHIVAAATFVLWWGVLDAPWQVALVNAVCVLLITCPCALALAVPAVQVVAVGALFRRGVLVASATALERLAGADHAVLDKTGTLTEGRPVLIPDGQDADTLTRAASLARASRHPLAQALVRACPDAPLAPGVREVPGRGLQAGDARLGSAAFCGVEGVADGMTLVFRDGAKPPVGFRFADRMREDAPDAVAALKDLGLTAELLSGDGEGAVAALAWQAGIPEWRAGADPAAKASRIAALKAQGRHPLMVGDGINDAAALAAAHVSASPAGATDLAQTAADLVLQREGSRRHSRRGAHRAARAGDRPAEHRLLAGLQRGGRARCGGGPGDAAGGRGGDGVILHHRGVERAACGRRQAVNSLFLLVPVSLLLGFIGLLGFLWALRTRQYDDLEGAASRILFDDETPRKETPK